MINKKGFTLMELLVTILILVVILAIAIPSVMGIMNRGKERAYNTQIDSFLATTKDYVIDKNITEYDWIGDKAYVTLDDLANAGYINLPIKNPKNNKDFSVASCIIIDKTNKKAYDYTYNEKCNMPSGNLVAGTTGGYLSDAVPYLGTPVLRNQIESIEIVNHKNVPNGINSYDVSVEADESIMLWYEAGTTPGLYKVYIGAEGRVYANENSNSLFAYLTNLTSINIQSLDTSKVTTMYRMFYDTNKLTTLEFGSRFITNNVKNMSYMFQDMENLTTIKTPTGENVINFDTSQVTDMSYMFWGADKLTTLELGPNFETNNVKKMRYTFNMENLITIKTPAGVNIINFDTANATDISGLFAFTKLSSIEFGPKFVTTNATDISQLFAYMYNLTTIKTPSGVNVINFDTSKVIDMHAMFHGIEVSTLEFGSNFVTSNVTNMEHMFDGMTNLTTIKHTGGVDNLLNFDTSKVTTMFAMFGWAGTQKKLTALEFGSNFITSNVTNMESMFSQLSVLTSLDIRHFDFDTITLYSGMLHNVPTTAKIIVNSAGNTWLDNHGFSAWNVREIVD